MKEVVKKYVINPEMTANDIHEFLQWLWLKKGLLLLKRDPDDGQFKFSDETEYEYVPEYLNTKEYELTWYVEDHGDFETWGTDGLTVCVDKNELG